jgi:hypothetical protein
VSKLGFTLVIASLAFIAGFYTGKARLDATYAPQEACWENGASTDNHHRRLFCGVELADGRHVTWFEDGGTCHSLIEREP